MSPRFNEYGVAPAYRQYVLVTTPCVSNLLLLSDDAKARRSNRGHMCLVLFFPRRRSICFTLSASLKTSLLSLPSDGVCRTAKPPVSVFTSALGFCVTEWWAQITTHSLRPINPMLSCYRHGVWTLNNMRRRRFCVCVCVFVHVCVNRVA